MNVELSFPLYLSVGPALILLARVIHYQAVTRYLKENNVAVASSSSIRDWNEWAAYKRARLANNERLTWWYVLWAIQVILFFYMLGWFAFAGGFLKFITPTHFVDSGVGQAGYRTVFDVEQSGYRQWPFALFGLIFVVVGFAMPTLLRMGIMGGGRLWMEKWLPRIFVVGGTFWTATALASTFVDYRRDVDALQNGEAKIVDGRVEHYWQVPNKSEAFDVGGVRFQYGEGLVIAGFNHTASRGGPIREGLPVKIWYWNEQILRLQMKTES